MDRAMQIEFIIKNFNIEKSKIIGFSDNEINLVISDALNNKDINSIITEIIKKNSIIKDNRTMLYRIGGSAKGGGPIYSRINRVFSSYSVDIYSVNYAIRNIGIMWRREVDYMLFGKWNRRKLSRKIIKLHHLEGEEVKKLLFYMLALDEKLKHHKVNKELLITNANIRRASEHNECFMGDYTALAIKGLLKKY